MITEEQRQYILRHRHERPYTKVAKDAGVSLNTLYLTLRKQGAMTKISEQWGEQRKKAALIVPKVYATMGEREIEKKYGIHRYYISQVAKRLGLKHSQETISRLRQKGGIMVQQVWKAERTRVLSGQPQVTNIKFAKRPYRVTVAIKRLTDVYNYFTDEEVGGLYTMYYDEDTKRTPNEHTFTKRYGLKFEKA